jgi:flavodoxin I
MKSLVVYDSFFGNTEKIAQAIGKGLGTAKEVQVVKVSQVTHEILTGLDYLVVGSPTRGFQPSPAIKTFVKNLATSQLEGVKVTAFDTRIPMTDKTPGFLKFMVKLFGYADKPILDGLKNKGGMQVVPSEGFFVLESEGPLDEGELKRAEEWGAQIKKAS